MINVYYLHLSCAHLCDKNYQYVITLFAHVQVRSIHVGKEWDKVNLTYSHGVKGVLLNFL